MFWLIGNDSDPHVWQQQESGGSYVDRTHFLQHPDLKERHLLLHSGAGKNNILGRDDSITEADH